MSKIAAKRHDADCTAWGGLHCTCGLDLAGTNVRFALAEVERFKGAIEDVLLVYEPDLPAKVAETLRSLARPQ